ncbi:MAG: hypothetical protein AAGH15_09180 [Myxococcota bacterium]
MHAFRLSFLLSLAALLALGAGCGDDDGGTDSEMGPDVRVDAGGDGGGEDLGTGDMGATDMGIGASMCPPGECDLRTGASCDTEAGEGCYFVQGPAGEAAAPRCVAVGTGMSGVSCTQPQDCAPGLACVARDEAAGGNFCAPTCCSGGPADCEGEEICRGFVDMGGASLGFGYCDTTDQCDLVLQNDCADGEICIAVAVDLEGTADGSSDCVPEPAETAGPGEACGGTDPACAGGLVCLQLAANPTTTCERYCNPGAPAGMPGSCPLGSACTGQINEFPADVGFCLPEDDA